MDILAALALVMVIEGLALAVLARSVPELLLSLKDIGPGQLRLAGAALVVAGGAFYVLIRGA